tara:strand:- start:2877 stop:4550 length:1674 start_codon:yes stop_codon:yes gene_type:complete
MPKTKLTTETNLKAAFAELRKTNPLLDLEKRTLKNDVEYNVFKSAPKTLRDLFDAIPLLHGDFPLLLDQGQQLSYSETISKAKNLANYLAEQGIKPGDKVGICMQNCAEWIIAHLAISGHGATSVPLNSWWREEELKYGVEHSEIKIIFLDRKRYEFIKDLAVQKVIIGEDQIDGCTNFLTTVKGNHDTWPERNAKDEDVNVILYTSGSTGMPKGVMLSHLAVINALFGFYTFGELRGIIHQEELLGVENASILLNVPLFHVTGLITQFLLSMLGKRNIVLMRKWDATEALELITKHKVTNLSGVPAQSWDLLNHPEVDNYDLSSLTDIAAGGAARPEEQVINLDKKFRIPQSFAWGMTETTAIGTLLRGNDYLERPNSAGLCVPDLTEIRIIDDKWNFLDVGQIGEMVFKSPTNTIGYLKNPEETINTIKDGWLKTGDLGYLDTDGYIFIVDRKKALIIRGGENISCLEVENALDKYNGIVESCVCGIYDEKFGEVVGAYIYAEEDLDTNLIKEFLSKYLANYKAPEIFKFTDKPLPRIASEKLDRVGIKELLAKK